MSDALATMHAYFDAWTSKDLDRAMRFVAEYVICDAPAGRIEGAGDYREFMAPFVEILVSVRLRAAFGDGDMAVVVSDTETAPVASAPAAECVTVLDGKIAYSRFIFDRAPFQAARAAAPS